MIFLLILSVKTAFCDEKPVTLQEDAYAAALMTNENIKIAEEGVVQADSQVDQARSYLLPHRTLKGTKMKRF